MSVIHLTTKDFQQQVLEEKGIVFVDFYASWCGPCQVVGPIIDELSEDEQFKNKVKFVKINVDENSQLANQYNIFSIPTFIIFKDGKPVNQLTGAMGKEALIGEINKIVNL